MKQLIPIAGVILLIAAGVWYFVIAPQSTQRFPDGYTWELNSLGVTGYPDEETGQYAEGTTLEDDPINLTLRTINADSASDGAVRITDYYETRDATTDTVTWSFSLETLVDSETGQHVEGETAGDYFFLPRNLDKDETYVISNSSYFSLPMTFQSEEEVAGINTYLYGHYEAIDDTIANAAFVELEDGQSVWCDDFSLEYWAEPNTGEIIKYREWCEGDWVVDNATGERLYTISRWGGETTGDDLIRRAREVNSLLNSNRMNTLYIPGALAIVGLVLLLMGFFLPGSAADNKAQ